MHRALPPLALAFCAGAAARLAFAVPLPFIWLAFAVALAGTLLSRDPRASGRWAMAVLAAAGLLRTAAWVQSPADSVSRLADRKWVRLHGRVTADPVAHPWGRSVDLEVSRADTTRGTEPASGRVRVTLPAHRPPPAYGALVSVLGRLRRPDDAANPGEVPPAQYLRRDGIVATMDALAAKPDGPARTNPVMQLALRGKHALDRGIRATLPPIQAGLLCALLFSDTAALPESVQQDFARAGTVHILSTSGLHIVLLAALLSFALPARRPSARRWRAAFLLVALVFFAMMTGLRPAVLRALLMTGAVIAAPLFDREPDVWASLSLAALCLVAISPGNLLDPGFQLSFAAAVSLALRFDGRRRQRGSRARRWVRDSVQTSIVASAATAPLAVRYFGTFSIASPLSNLLVVPALAPVMGLGLLQGALWHQLPAASRLLASLNRPLLQWILDVTSGVGGSNWSAVDTGSPSSLTVAALYTAGFLVLLAFRLWPASGPLRGRRTPLFACAGAGALASILAWLAWAPRNTLRVTFLDVGQGDCTLIQTPHGRAVLVDAGGRYESGEAVPSNTGARVVLPALRRAGVRRLDLVVLSHPHEDHAGGLPAVFAALPVGLWLDSGQSHAAPGYEDALQLAKGRIPLRIAERGQTIALEPGVDLRVLAPSRPLTAGTRDDLNNNSIVCRLTYGSTSVLLAGDAETEEERLIPSRGTGIRSDVLKTGHHGSSTSSGTAFLKAVEPRWAVVSCGRRNRYGHPDPATLERLRRAGATILRTDLDGAAVMESDGRSIRVRSCRWQMP